MAEPGFTGAGLDRADHLRLDEEWLAAQKLTRSGLILELDDLDPVLCEDNRLAWSPMGFDAGETIFLGLQDGTPLFAPLVRSDALGRRAWSIFRVLSQMRPHEAAIWGAARSLNEWHNKQRFCGICGTATEAFRAGWGRRCRGCGAEHFPRVDPVVIMLAEHEGKVLVGRQPGYPAGRYSALAGFVEPGESIEEAVARELMEEAGVAVSDVRYVASQPWPFPGSLMIACVARAQDDALTLDTNELEDAFWVDKAGIAAALAGKADAPFQTPPPYAIANTLLTRWLGEG